MSDNTGSQHTIPLLNGNEPENDLSSLEARKKDHARLTRLISLLRKTDDVDSKIYDIVHNIVIREFLPETPPYEPEDIAEIIGQFFQPEEVLFPGFLKKTPFPYRMLRLALSLYKMNPIHDHQISILRMSDAEKLNKGLTSFCGSSFWSEQLRRRLKPICWLIVNRELTLQRLIRIANSPPRVCITWKTRSPHPIAITTLKHPNVVMSHPMYAHITMNRYAIQPL